MKNKTWVVNGILAALYIAVTILIAPFGFTNIQFRLSEIFNHLVVFDKRYFWGIVGGVFISNLLLSSLGAVDLVFGVLHSVLSLLITIVTTKYISKIWARMVINTIVFTIMMFIIAGQLYFFAEFPFWFTYLTTAVSELVVMAIGIPIMIAINNRVKFKQLISN